MTDATLPPAWELALLSVREARRNLPPHVCVHEIPAPVDIAPYAAAISGETALHITAENPAIGRLIILYDPEGQPGWDGKFRVVVLITAETDLALGEDPLAGEVAWSWLREALTNRQANYSHLTGTATATINRSFTGSTLAGSSAGLEIRASWTPDSHDLSSHFLAWIDTMLQSTGLSPAENVIGIRRL